MKKKGATRAQLQARIERLEAELRRYHAGDTLRAEGEHWYELREYFDAEQITRIPSPFDEPTFLMGMLSDTFIVEVPSTAEPADVDKFLALLRRNGIAPALAIRKGVRFLRLATVDEEMEAKLDAAQMKVVQDGQEEEERLSALRESEGRSEGAEVPEVPGATDRGEAAVEPDPVRDAPGE